MKASGGTNAAWADQLLTPHWYVVRSNANQERLARMSLRAEGFGVYYPQLPRAKKNGDISAIPMFVGYLFVRLVLGAEGSTRVFATRGVASIVGNGVRPTPIADKAIHSIRKLEREAFAEHGMVADPIEIPEFEEGQPVTITTGPLATLAATFVKKLDDERCQVLLRIVGDSPRLARIALAHIK